MQDDTARRDGSALEREVRRPEPERSTILAYLIDYWEGEDDNSMSHAMIFAPSDFEAVRRTVQAFAQHVDWLQQQCDERAVLKAQLQTAEAALRSAKQPLHAEMLRLNKRVIELTAELDRVRMTPNVEVRRAERLHCLT